MDELHAFWNDDTIPERLEGRDEERILQSFFYFRHLWCLHPITLVSYWREAYLAEDDDRVRVTFDGNLHAAPTASYDPTASVRSIEIVPPQRVILEIKVQYI